MKKKKNLKTTTNRKVFNQEYKRYLERIGKIRCSYCKYHKSENKTTNHYGGFDYQIKYPSWKLASKNKKQWEKKPIKISKRGVWFNKNREYTYIDF